MPVTLKHLSLKNRLTKTENDYDVLKVVILKMTEELQIYTYLIQIFTFLDEKKSYLRGSKFV